LGCRDGSGRQIASFQQRRSWKPGGDRNRATGQQAAASWILFIAKATLSIEAVTAQQAEVAREAWRRYGKERHPLG